MSARDPSVQPAEGERQKLPGGAPKELDTLRSPSMISQGRGAVEIKILGMGCPKCRRVEALVRGAVSDAGVEAASTKVKEMDAPLAYDVMNTPAPVAH